MRGSHSGPTADLMRRWISAPMRSRTRRTVGSLPDSSAVVQAAATSGSSATASARLRSACSTRLGIGSLTSVKYGTWLIRSR